MEKQSTKADHVRVVVLTELLLATNMGAIHACECGGREVRAGGSRPQLLALLLLRARFPWLGTTPLIVTARVIKSRLSNAGCGWNHLMMEQFSYSPLRLSIAGSVSGAVSLVTARVIV